MSDYHILDKSIDGKTVNCVFHIVIPDEVNSVGTNWRAAVEQYFDPVPLLPDNDVTENTAITNGEIWEVQKTVRYSSINLTDEQCHDEVEVFYADNKNKALQKLSKSLDFFGKKGDV